MTKRILYLLGLLIIFSCSNNTKQESMGFFQKLFGKKETPKEFTQEEWDEDYENKQAGLEKVLGKMHDMVGHAIIPFEVGGTVDMYYFPNGISGTGFATMELLNPDGNGPIPNRLGTYELVSFTKEPFSSNEGEQVPFNKIERRLCGIMTTIGAYSTQARLGPNETAELPGKEGQPNLCVLFDEYKPSGIEFRIGERKHGLLLVMEIFREEMEYAMEYGSEMLIEKLKLKGHYPYSDLNRESVVK
jgi:hypothetical protein